LIEAKSIFEEHSLPKLYKEAALKLKQLTKLPAKEA
jgi:hypothetical protein